MHLRSKLTSDIMSENREFRRKNKAKPTSGAHFASFVLKKKKKKTLYLLKNKRRYSILCSKNKSTYQFYVFAIKSPLGNVSVSSEFRFDYNLLKTLHFLRKIYFSSILKNISRAGALKKIKEKNFLQIYCYTSTE